MLMMDSVLLGLFFLRKRAQKGRRSMVSRLGIFARELDMRLLPVCSRLARFRIPEWYDRT
jgi:hypothetical protein